MKAPVLPTREEVKAYAEGQGVTWRDLAKRHPLRLLLVFCLGSLAGPWVWAIARLALKAATGILKIF